MKSRYLKVVVAALVAQAIVSPAHALVSSSTDPSTIIENAANLATGRTGQAIAVLGLMGAFLGIHSHGFGGLLIAVCIIAGIFSAAFIIQQLLGTSV